MTDLPNPYLVNPRKKLTDKQRLQMFIDAEGRCALCGGKINGVKETWTDEHFVPLWAGGSNALWNRAPVHQICAQEKTAKEATDRSRGRKFAQRHYGAKRSSRPLPGGKRSKWKKKLTGEVVLRETET